MLRFSTLKLRGEKVKGRESKIKFVFNDAFIKEGSLVQVVYAKGIIEFLYVKSSSFINLKI